MKVGFARRLRRKMLVRPLACVCAGSAAITSTIVLMLLLDAEWADQSLLGVKLKLLAAPRSQMLSLVPEAIADRAYLEAWRGKPGEVDVWATQCKLPMVTPRTRGKRAAASPSSKWGSIAAIPPRSALSSCAFTHASWALPRTSKGTTEMADLLDPTNFDLAPCGLDASGAYRGGVRSEFPGAYNASAVSCFAATNSDGHAAKSYANGGHFSPTDEDHHMMPCCLHIYATMFSIVMDELVNMPLPKKSKGPLVSIVDGSTTLGTIRHGGIIPQDHDIDMQVFALYVCPPR